MDSSLLRLSGLGARVVYAGRNVHFKRKYQAEFAYWWIARLYDGHPVGYCHIILYVARPPANAVACLRDDSTAHSCNVNLHYYPQLHP